MSSTGPVPLALLLVPLAGLVAGLWAEGGSPQTSSLAASVSV